MEKLLFIADDGIRGLSLYVADGLSVTQLDGVFPGYTSVFVQLAAATDGRLFWITPGDFLEPNARLWTSDGTRAGSAELVTRPTLSTGAQSFLDHLVPSGNRVFFEEALVSSAPEGSEAQRNIEYRLFSADASDTGPVEIQRFDAPISGIVGFDGGAYFSIGSSIKGLLPTDPELADRGLWFTDGTAEGTTRLIAGDGINIGEDGFLNGLLHFPMIGESGGMLLMSTDGTIAGTRLVGELREDVVHVGMSTMFLGGVSEWGDAAVVDDTLYFLAVVGPQRSGRLLYATDGTGAGTRVVSEWQFVSEIEALGDTLLIAGLLPGENVLDPEQLVPEEGLELFFSDGTAEGTERLEISPVDWSKPYDLTLFGEKAAFGALDGFLFGPPEGFQQLGTAQLWITDGTIAGTFEIELSVDPLISPASPWEFTAVDDLVYFTALNTAIVPRLDDDRFTMLNGVTLWRSDGTIAGTEQVFDPDPSNSGFGTLNLVGAFDPARVSANRIEGGPLDDRLVGLSGNGMDLIDGGPGIDSVHYPLPRSLFAERVSERGDIRVSLAGGELDVLTGIERINLTDGTYIYDLAGEDLAFTYRLYSAAFARTPDVAGLRYWNDLRTDGLDDRSLAQAFIESPEFAAKFGSDPTDEEFVQALYANVLYREPDAGGEAFWLGAFLTGSLDRADMLLAFSDSPENLARNEDNYDDGVWVA